MRVNHFLTGMAQGGQLPFYDTLTDVSEKCSFAEKCNSFTKKQDNTS